ncbi:hypothetical protein M407DRAFT_75162, partial [Tulasnella calospora MUT 4182]
PAPITKDMDLTSRLTASFSRSASAEDAPDCPICFNSISPGAPTWSCTPADAKHQAYSVDHIHVEHGGTNCCWTTFHLKCIKAWATKSVTETRDAYVARGLTERSGEWRCPGCQTKRAIVPADYRCFCGRVVDPRPGRLAIPHSCGESCARSRERCEHPCPLQCHPGPCPPCILIVTQQCHCGRQTISNRCSAITAHSGLSAFEPLSCGQTCGRLLNCGVHHCKTACHPGPCEPCDVSIVAECYCGRERKSMTCGTGEPKECMADGKTWTGRWECGQVCDRPLDCGVHRCPKTCHPPSSSPAHCPMSPDVVQTCPCWWQTPLSSLPGPPRQTCSSPIPTCGKTCSKQLPSCEHLCQEPCHIGPCALCTITVEEKCRCGRAGRTKKCHEITAGRERAVRGEEDEEDPRDDITGAFLCKRKCEASKNCGKHICGRVCCPLAALAGVGESSGKGKRRQRNAPTAEELAELDPEGWHVCDFVCGKPLACGNHTCSERDHRGPCPTCLQASFEELVCNCGRTIIDPPIPCGTRIRCSFPCARPPLPCGHPKAPHACHEEDICPPCPYLSEKVCACGKSIVPNVKCSQTTIHCGLKCGKLLDCGFHSCDKICHAGPCGSCSQICGKPRRLCLPLLHPCTKSCHAPSACSETEPCTAMITLQCACGRQKQPAVCGKSTSSSGSPPKVLPCMQECRLAERNERLAAALGITRGEDGKASALGQGETKYAEKLQQFWKVNAAFAASVEKSLNDFVSSEKKVTVLRPMPPPKRKFVRDLAEVYRLDATDIDPEPRRSVELRRRLDTRIPKPLLSEVVNPPKAAAAGPSTSAWGKPVASSSRPSSSRPRTPVLPEPRTSSPAIVVVNPAPIAQLPPSADGPSSEVPSSWDED